VRLCFRAVWKLGSVQAGERAVGLVRATEDRVVLVRVHGAENGFRVRAVDIDSGELLWERPARQAVVIAGCYVEIVSCIQRSGGNAPLRVDVRTGDRVDDEHGVCRLGATGDRIPLIPDETSGTWSVKGRVLSSERTGDFVLRERDNGSALWRRREALAHGVAAAFYHGDMERGEVTRVLVVLTHFRLLFGLSCIDGSVVWTCDIASVLSRNGFVDAGVDLRLIAGHERNAVVLAMSDTDTACIVIRATDGLVGRVRVHRAYLASQAAVISARSEQRERDAPTPEESTCVIMINSDGAERADDAECSKGSRTWLLAGTGGDSATAYAEGRVLWNITVPYGGLVATLALAQSRRPFKTAVGRTGARRLVRNMAFHGSADGTAALVLSMDGGLASDGVGVTSSLISSRTGAIFFERRHENASGDIKALACENWFLYTFWNSGTLEQEIHLLEMLKARNLRHSSRTARLQFIRNHVRVLLPLTDWPVVNRAYIALEQAFLPNPKSFDGSQKVSDQQSGRPNVLQSSWHSTHRIGALGVTATERGHTAQRIVFGFSSGRIGHLSRAGLTKRLHPAVSVKDTSGIPPMDRGTLSFWPSETDADFVSGGRAVPELLSEGGVVTAPFWRRESSSQLACIGTDILYTVVIGAGVFDKLPEEFSFSTVALSIGVLSVCVIVSRHGARKNVVLKSMWASVT
jgi:hypothetical protein